MATFDGAVRSFLGVHPAGTVVTLGEGLETQFWRLDNGRVRWLTVDLPETLELRGRLLPDVPRQSSHSGSALDLGWVDGLSPADPILVTAQGLFPISSAIKRDLAVTLWTWLFNAHEHALLGAIPGVETLRDVAPPLKRDLASFGIAAIGRLPRRLRYSLPVIQVLQAKFRAVSPH